MEHGLEQNTIKIHSIHKSNAYESIYGKMIDIVPWVAQEKMLIERSSNPLYAFDEFKHNQVHK